MRPFEQEFQTILEGIRNDPYVQAIKGKIPGHRLATRQVRGSRWASCACGWSYAPDRRSPGLSQYQGVETAARRHAALAVERPELFARSA